MDKGITLCTIGANMVMSTALAIQSNSTIAIVRGPRGIACGRKWTCALATVAIIRTRTVALAMERHAVDDYEFCCLVPISIAIVTGVAVLAAITLNVHLSYCGAPMAGLNVMI